jgi:hypothetical protein
MYDKTLKTKKSVFLNEEFFILLRRSAKPKTNLTNQKNAFLAETHLW